MSKIFLLLFFSVSLFSKELCTKDTTLVLNEILMDKETKKPAICLYQHERNIMGKIYRVKTSIKDGKRDGIEKW